LDWLDTTLQSPQRIKITQADGNFTINHIFIVRKETISDALKNRVK